MSEPSSNPDDAPTPSGGEAEASASPPETSSPAPKAEDLAPRGPTPEPPSAPLEVSPADEAAPETAAPEAAAPEPMAAAVEAEPPSSFPDPPRPAEAGVEPDDHEALHAAGPEPRPEPLPAQGLPPQPPSGEGAQPTKPLKLPPQEFGRLVAFAAILISTGIFLTYGLSADQGPTLRSLALAASAWTEFSTQGWRLVSGTLTHTSLWIGIVSVFLAWIALSEFESRAGAGGTLLLLIPGGAALNLVRVQVEPAHTLLHGSGLWCVSVAAAIGASVLAGRRGENPRRPLALASIQGGLFAAFMFFTGNWDSSLLTSAGAAALLGGALGLAWPSGVQRVANLGTAPRGQTPLRVGAGLVALLVLVAALAQVRSNETGPPGLEPLPAVTEGFFADPLLVKLKLPGGWSEMPVPKEVDCGTCGTKATWDRAHINDPIPGPKQCKNCSDEVLHGNRHAAYYVGGGDMLGGPQRLLALIVQDSNQLYDADTLIEEFVQHQLRRDDSEFREAPIEREEFFATQAYERGFRMVLRGKKERVTLYAFRTKKRMMLLMFRGPAPTSPLSVEWEDAFHQAIAETVEPWKPKPKPSESPAASPEASESE